MQASRSRGSCERDSGPTRAKPKRFKKKNARAATEWSILDHVTSSVHASNPSLSTLVPTRSISRPTSLVTPKPSSRSLKTRGPLKTHRPTTQTRATSKIPSATSHTLCAAPRWSGPYHCCKGVLLFIDLFRPFSYIPTFLFSHVHNSSRLASSRQTIVARFAPCFRAVDFCSHPTARRQTDLTELPWRSVARPVVPLSHFFPSLLRYLRSPLRILTLSGMWPQLSLLSSFLILTDKHRLTRYITPTYAASTHQLISGARLWARKGNLKEDRHGDTVILISIKSRHIENSEADSEMHPRYLHDPMHGC